MPSCKLVFITVELWWLNKEVWMNTVLKLI